MNKLLTGENVKFAVGSALALVLIRLAYGLTQYAKQAYNGVDKAVDSAIDPLADAFFNSNLYQGGGVEYADFKVSNLYRDYFDNNWVMKPEVYGVMVSAYPNELSAILSVNNQLLEQYRERVRKA